MCLNLQNLYVFKICKIDHTVLDHYSIINNNINIIATDAKVYDLYCVNQVLTWYQEFDHSAFDTMIHTWKFTTRKMHTSFLKMTIEIELCGNQAGMCVGMH